MFYFQHTSIRNFNFSTVRYSVSEKVLKPNKSSVIIR